MSVAFFVSECGGVVFFLSLLPLLCATAGGLVLSFLQAATQIQEQSLGFLCKGVICCGVLYFFGELYAERLIELFRSALRLMLAAGGVR